LQVDYVTVVENKPIASAKYRLPVQSHSSTFGETQPAIAETQSASLRVCETQSETQSAIAEIFVAFCCWTHFLSFSFIL